MRSFEYAKPSSVKSVLSLLGRSFEQAKVLAGGVDLLGEMKEGIISPKRVVNLKGVKDLYRLDFSEKDGLTLGALVTLTQIESHPTIIARYRALAEGAHSVATPQIRNMSTIGGNLCQRPRCWYYRHHDINCLKKGGRLCFAYNGENKYHAILGGGPCYIVHPSDCAPPLIAFDSSVTLASPRGERSLSLEDFFVLPSQRMDHETVLEPDEIVTFIKVPAPPKGTGSAYVKIREKQSFDFALVGCAAVVRMEGGVCRQARIVLAGVAPIPWRSREAEEVLEGKAITEEIAEKAGQAAVAKAEPLAQNAYKIPMTVAAVKRAILRAAGQT
ncbi:MAG: xanthine dehydrogenase family protein subunit M [Armatimonadetes bacterium]|nr:xanthine dehydrogenase family protein subunit M [Armatimonadota bacterium]MDW8121109.1 xanthine dehydrogenase family protein subunit M [Armatimonadota bacterium]